MMTLNDGSENWFWSVLQGRESPTSRPPSANDMEDLRTTIKVQLSSRHLTRIEADDVLQEVLCSLVNRRNGRSAKSVENPRAYLRRMINNLIVTEIRRLARRDRLANGCKIASDVEQSWSLSERMSRLPEAKLLIDAARCEVQGRCSPLEQEIWRLRIDQELSFSEIAAHLGMSVNQAATLFYRVRAALRIFKAGSSQRCHRPPNAASFAFCA